METINAIQSREFDLVVIGGGCVGTAVAMFASQAGSSVALVEKDDFGARTSGASSEMIHGGLQYLAKMQFAIVRKSNQYAGRIMLSCRHLVEPIPIVFPYYEGGTVSARALRMLLRTYERYNQRYKHAPPGRPMSPGQIVERIPMIRPDKLAGGSLYYEWGIDAPRMCLANAIWAVENGAFVRNHAAVVDIERRDGRIAGVWVDDERTGERILLTAKAVINATGPYTDKICELAGAVGQRRIRPTKGVHLIFPKISDTGMVVQFIDDRFGVIIPRGAYTLLGTTDDDYYGPLDHYYVTQDEFGYLMQGAQQFLPGLSKDDVVDTKWGVRPTAFFYGQIEDKLSRDHMIVDHEPEGAPGLWSIYGGKLATHTWMAEDLLNRLAKQQESRYDPIEEYRLPGGPDLPVEEYVAEIAPEATAKYGVAPEDVDAVVRRHGTRYEAVLDLTLEDPSLKRNLCRCRINGQPVRRVLAAEVVYAARYEMALTADDIGRRTGLSVGLCNRNRCLDAAAEVLDSLQLKTTPA
ncbi:MAG: glycerol-3-phosphate dehydrogenase/oxidase [Phycisphaerae bacterium]|nr:glycerol-3-phosphate dehydrogenase/oxidase [Phycisphaerae bacterium]